MIQIFQREFGLQWEQINEIYNHLTDDSKTELTFDKFEDLIKILAHKKQVDEIGRTPLVLSQSEFDLLRTHGDAVLRANTRNELRDILHSLLGQQPGKTSHDFSDETIDRIWDKLEVSRASLTPLNDALKSAQISDHRQTSDRLLGELGRERGLSASGVDCSDDFERLKTRQLKNLAKLMSLCTAAKQVDSSGAVTKLVFDVMSFGEGLHAGLEQIGQLITSKNDFINYLTLEAEDLKTEATRVQGRLDEFVEEISHERPRTVASQEQLSLRMEEQGRVEEQLRQEIRRLELENSAYQSRIAEFEEALHQQGDGPPATVLGKAGPEPPPDQPPGQL